MQKQTTIKFSLLLAPHKQALPLDGHVKFRNKTCGLLVNPKIICKHLLPRMLAEFAKEILRSTRILMPLETKTANQLSKLSSHNWNNTNLTTHTRKGVRDSASLGKAMPSVILPFLLRVFKPNAHITLTLCNCRQLHCQATPSKHFFPNLG
jgi:hypothetical protein